MITLEQVEQASKEWGFNCGPGALCGVLGKTPEDIRPFLGDFEAKRYTNPTLMYDILKRLGVEHETVYRNNDNKDGEIRRTILDQNSRDKYKDARYLIRIQWGGPWTKEGVPMQARYRQTHWIGVRYDGLIKVFDINAIEYGGWISEGEWINHLVPWLCKECVPRWDGSWWPTHIIKVQP